MARHGFVRTLPSMLLACSLLVVFPAYADAPTPEERTRVEAKLRGLGFERWSQIEREDDGREWGIEDARLTDGRQFDVRLAADDLRELSRKAE